MQIKFSLFLKYGKSSWRMEIKFSLFVYCD
jgi:hypothetical protein